MHSQQKLHEIKLQCRNRLCFWVFAYFIFETNQTWIPISTIFLVVSTYGKPCALEFIEQYNAFPQPEMSFGVTLPPTLCHSLCVA